ncbi:cytochrome c nitrite reductase subunit NrfD [Providencia sp. Me31A]|uniref:cytochrome c nitrite reductase subunit NrfD n=1 Tax=Providencia sp. Me31A TaxID=3392637 RepID=UPI003D2A2690
MTTASAFHFESLVWDWPIAVYLFLIGISAGLVVLAVLLRQYYPNEANSNSTLMRTTLVLAPTTVVLGLLILIFHLTRPWTFWKLMFHYSPTSVMSMGVMLFQVYMAVLVVWLAKIYENELVALQQKWLPKFNIIPRLLAVLNRAMRFLDIVMLVLAVLLGAYTGFLLSALKSYPFLNNPLLPALFLFSGISSGIAVALIALALRYRKNIHNNETAFLHRIEGFVIWLEIFLLTAFFVGLALGDDGKIRSLIAALGGGFWTWWFWIGVVGCGFIVPLLLKKWMDKGQGAARVFIVSGASLLGVFCLRFFVLYAGQLTVA